MDEAIEVRDPPVRRGADPTAGSSSDFLVGSPSISMTSGPDRDDGELALESGMGSTLPAPALEPKVGGLLPAYHGSS
jgi:hypothetical protein